MSCMSEWNIYTDLRAERICYFPIQFDYKNKNSSLSARVDQCCPCVDGSNGSPVSLGGLFISFNATLSWTGRFHVSSSPSPGTSLPFRTGRSAATPSPAKRKTISVRSAPDFKWFYICTSLLLRSVNTPPPCSSDITLQWLIQHSKSRRSWRWRPHRPIAASWDLDSHPFLCEVTQLCSLPTPPHHAVLP